MDKLDQKMNYFVCKTCKSTQLAVLINPPANEMVFEIKNNNGDSIGYVCANCTNIPRKEFFGLEKGLCLKKSGYFEMANLFDIFIKANGNIKCIVENGSPLAHRSGTSVPVKQNLNRPPSSIVIKTKRNLKPRPTLLFRDIAAHYVKKCKSDCILCFRKVCFSESVDNYLTEYAKKIKNKEVLEEESLVSFPDEVVVKQEQLSPSLLDAENSQEFFPSEHQNIEKYLKEIQEIVNKPPSPVFFDEETLLEAPVSKKRKRFSEDENSFD